MNYRQNQQYQQYQAPQQQFQNPGYQGYQQVEKGNEYDRRRQILSCIGRDPSVIDPDERSALTKYGGMNQFAMLGIFGTIFLPAGLLLAKTMEKERKLRILKYGMGFQAVVGGVFLYSSFKLSTLVKGLDDKYFQHLGIDQIKEYNPHMWNNRTSPIPPQSAGNVLSNMNRQPYGGNTQYYQPQNPIFGLQNQQTNLNQRNQQINTQPIQNNAAASTPTEPSDKE